MTDRTVMALSPGAPIRDRDTGAVFTLSHPTRGRDGWWLTNGACLDSDVIESGFDIDPFKPAGGLTKGNPS